VSYAEETIRSFREVSNKCYTRHMICTMRSWRHLGSRSPEVHAARWQTEVAARSQAAMLQRCLQWTEALAGCSVGDMSIPYIHVAKVSTTSNSVCSVQHRPGCDMSL